MFRLCVTGSPLAGSATEFSLNITRDTSVTSLLCFTTCLCADNYDLYIKKLFNRL